MIIAASPEGCAIIPAQIAMGIRARLAPSHSFIAPLAAPAEADLIDLVAIADPATPWPKCIKHARKPTVVLIGDDPGTPFGMGGPDAWRCTVQLGRWARCVLVHGAGGRPEHYAEAYKAAQRVGRVAMIESTSRHASEWAERLNCPRTLLIMPRTGCHPIAEAVQ